MVPGHNRQSFDLTLAVQTRTIVFFLGNKIKFCMTVIIFGCRSMVALNMDIQTALITAVTCLIRVFSDMNRIGSNI